MLSKTHLLTAAGTHAYSTELLELIGLILLGGCPITKTRQGNNNKKANIR